MKKYSKILCLLIVLIGSLFVFNLNILADDEGGYTLTSSSVSVNPTSLTIEVGNTKTFTITVTNAMGDVSISSSKPDVAKVNVSEWEPGAIEEGQAKSTTVTVTGVSAGNATITITADASTVSEESISETKTVNVTVKRNSANNNLSSLKVNGTSVPNFKPSTTTYSIDIDSEIADITATAEDAFAKVISGIGSKTLKYGKNQYDIKVTAENGDVKTYILIINRNDNRDTNNNLSSLTVDNGILAFNKNTTSYKVNVDTDVDKITINAVPESSKAKIDSNSIGIKNLKLGDNKFEIKVTAENGNVKTYTVTVNRKDNRDSNNYLSSLTVDNGVLTFNKNTTSYNVNVENTVNKITINAIAESEKSIVTGTGEKTLKEGNNKFEIKVTAENETVKTYTVIINRASEVIEEKLIKSLTIEGINITFDPNVYSYSVNIDNQESLNFNYELESGVSATLTGNEFLKNNSMIILKLAKGETTQEYIFNIYKQQEQNVEPVTPNQTNKKNKNWIIYVVIGVIAFAVIGFFAKKKDKAKKAKPVDQTPTPNQIDSTQSNQDLNTSFSQEVINSSEEVNNEIKDIEKLDL